MTHFPHHERPRASRIQLIVTTILKQQVWILAAVALLIVMGIAAWSQLPIEAYPELADPQVRIITLFPGKGSEEIERLITVPLEKELNGIPGQTALRSISLYGLSVITSVFHDGVSIPLVRSQVLERVSKTELPESADVSLEPDVGSLREIFRYTLKSPFYSTANLRAIQDWDMSKLFRQIPGVIGVVTEGGPSKAYLVNVDPYRLKAFSVSMQEVETALTNANATTGGNFIERNDEAYIIRGLGLLKNVSDIGSVVIKAQEDGTPILVKDVASVQVGQRVRRGQCGLNKDDDIIQGIILLRRGENPTAVLNRVKKALPGIENQLPKGVQMVPIYDRSELIQKTLITVGQNISIGILLVIIVLGFFFMNIRYALITACVIPLSVLFAFISLKAFRIPANLLSLGAIDFGILVDCAIMMTESIIRKLHHEGGSLSVQERIQLVVDAAGKVSRPIIFGILTIVITFLPIFTFEGVEGKLFRPLAITMVSALIGAGMLTLTVIPIICSLFFTKKPLIEKENLFLTSLHQRYEQLLSWSLQHAKKLIIGCVTLFAFSLFIFCTIGSEFLPHLEEGNIWLRTTVKPASVSVSESIHISNQIRRILLTFPEVKKVVSQVGGPDDGTDPHRFADHEYLIDLKSSHEWRAQFHRDKEQLIGKMQETLNQLPNVEYYFTQYIQTTLDESLSGVQGSLVAKIAGPDLNQLETIANQVGPLMKSTPGIVDVIIDPLIGQPQLSIDIDRAKAARYGLNVSDLVELVEMAIGGKVATEIIEGEKRFDLIVRLQEDYRDSQDALKDVWIDTPAGQKIPLSQIAQITVTDGATQIWREAGHRLATIRANVRGRDLATSVHEAQEKVAKAVHFPEGYQLIWSGEFERQQSASRQLSIVLPLTLLVIISVLFITFRSWRSALVVFCVVPMAAIGGILALWVTKTHFSIAAGVGFIALFGVAIQNGIFLISHIQQLQELGASLPDAVFEGSKSLMRPVLMTGLVALIGLIPAAVSTEIGSQTQRPFAIVIIGGLVSATLLSLFVLPAFYQVSSKIKFTQWLPFQSEI